MAAKRWSDLIQYSWHPKRWISPGLQLSQLSSHGSALQRLTVCPSQVKQQRDRTNCVNRSPISRVGRWVESSPKQTLSNQSMIEICNTHFLLDYCWPIYLCKENSNNSMFNDLEIMLQIKFGFLEDSSSPVISIFKNIYFENMLQGILFLL